MVFNWTSLWIVLVDDSTGLVEIVVVPSFEAVEAVAEFVVAIVLAAVEIVVVVQVVVQITVLVVHVIVVHVLVLVQVVVLVLDEFHCYYYYSLDAVVVDLEIAKC